MDLPMRTSLDVFDIYNNDILNILSTLEKVNDFKDINKNDYINMYLYNKDFKNFIRSKLIVSINKNKDNLLNKLNECILDKTIQFKILIEWFLEIYDDFGLFSMDIRNILDNNISCFNTSPREVILFRLRIFI